MFLLKQNIDLKSEDVKKPEIAKERNHTRCKRVGFYTHALYKIWHRCYIDKNEFEQDRILLYQKDILTICGAQHKTPHSRMYIVPKDPALILSPDNAMLVDKIQRKFLIAFWRLTKDKIQYVKYVKYFENYLNETSH